MIFFDSCINKNEVLTYKKVKGKLILEGFFLLLGLFIFTIAIIQIIDILTSDRINFDMMGLYILIIFAAFCLLITIGSILSYLLNKIAITNTHIIIRRGALGKLYVIPKSLILAKIPIHTSVKGTDIFQILLFLKNGKRLNTGLLHCKPKEFDGINNRLRFRQISKKSEIESEFTKHITERMIVKRNVIFPILTYFPVIFITITILLLLSGFNFNFGVQKNFSINGTVIDKQIENNKSNTRLKLVIYENEKKSTYKIDVSSNVFDNFEKDQNIIIKGKKGSLGILYDIWFYKS